MIEKLINEFAGYQDRARAEDDYLLKLRTEAEGVGSIQYGDDTSHGTPAGDRLEKATIRLYEARKEIAKKRVPRFEMAAETIDWFYERLKPEPALVMTLYIICGMSYRDISAATGKSVGWVSETVKKSGRILKMGLVNAKTC